MNRLAAFLVAAAAASSLMFAGCASAGGASSATTGPTPAAKEAASQSTIAPAKVPAPAQQSTAAPTNQAGAPSATKTNYPNKPITLIVPYPAGANTDLGARILTTPLAQELGVPIQVVNKEGANGQVGLTQMVMSKPDGYTLAYMNLPQAITDYLDPDRKAGFGRGDIVPVANHSREPGAFDVKTDSPYKTIKDLVDAAKAKPGVIRLGDPGILSLGDIEILEFEQLTGTKFAQVHFAGGAPGLAAMLGGHIDGFVSNVGDVVSLVRGDQARVLGVAGSAESPYLPGVKTMESQGYHLDAYVSNGVMAPKGTPKEIVDILNQAIKKVCDSAAEQKAMHDAGLTLQYLDTAQYEAFWSDFETQLRPIVASARERK